MMNKVLEELLEESKIKFIGEIKCTEKSSS